MATRRSSAGLFPMALLHGFVISLLLLLLGTGAQSVNPASNAGFYIVPVPVYAGNVLTADFNGGSGPRDSLLFFDSATPIDYDASYAYVTDGTDGLSMVSGLGPSIITLNATIQYGSLDSSSVNVTILVYSEPVVTYVLTNSGPSSTFQLLESFAYTLFAGASIELHLQYAGTDAPQFSYFTISVVADPTPIYAGQALIDGFNGETGPRSQFFYFDTVNASNYNANFVSITNTSTGLTMVADIGPVMIYIQATVQYSSTWSNDESSPVLVNLVVNGISAGISPLINSGPSNSYSLYKYFNYALYNYGTLGINLQYDSADSPQISNLFVSITPMSYSVRK